MTTILRLQGVSFDNEDLPLLSEYGYLPESGLVDLFKMQTDAFATNSAPGGSAATNQSTTTGGRVLSWADGITTAPDAGASSEYHLWRFNGVTSSQLARTVFAVFKVPEGASAMALFTGNAGGVEISLSTTINAVFNNGSARNVQLGAYTKGVWQSIVMALDATGIRASINNRPVAEIPWSAHGGAISAYTHYRFGRNSTTFSPRGEIALMGQYNRALGNDEMRGLARGLGAFARTKDITIGEA